jgi:hypothetical protein
MKSQEVFTDKLLPVFKELLSVLVKAAAGVVVKEVIERFFRKKKNS